MDALASAVDWVRLTFLGTVGTSLAILAIASLGFMSLSGRMPVKRGFATIIGCFILFSAAGIANALTSVIDSRSQPEAAEEIAVIQPAPPAAPEAYNPYTEASVRSPEPDLIPR